MKIFMQSGLNFLIVCLKSEPTRFIYNRLKDQRLNLLVGKMKPLNNHLCRFRKGGFGGIQRHIHCEITVRAGSYF